MILKMQRYALRDDLVSYGLTKSPAKTAKSPQIPKW